MGTTRNVDMSSQEIKVKKVEVPEGAEAAELNESDALTVESQDTAIQKPAKPRVQRQRGKKYAATRSKVDKARAYDALSAIELVKQLSYSRFEGTISADVVVTSTDVSAELLLPHASGQQKKVAVVDEAVLKQIEAGTLDFDILVSAPEFMPKLAKHAKLLGPKGLMPNPKNGTLTANPQQAVKELAAGKQLLKTEKKQPLMHVSLGKTSMDTKHLIENLQALAKAFQGKLVKVSLSATMGPGVKVDVESL